MVILYNYKRKSQMVKTYEVKERSTLKSGALLIQANTQSFDI